ncbi:hypothetical protein BOVATA_035350 [Babesia ovata]|uniref:Uncharacterized protein n=1 Tax=Babesia ovata TaxID=189622 RepID=A0A2H6KGB7_9APIC|nr:uncharacterized protein BOVATA_035350 [Babesia ovata]GBE62042.1 hypothetical protein BOVATA_035350 [Babesia ovata]
MARRSSFTSALGGKLRTQRRLGFKNMFGFFIFSSFSLKLEVWSFCSIAVSFWNSGEVSRITPSINRSLRFFELGAALRFCSLAFDKLLASSLLIARDRRKRLPFRENPRPAAGPCFTLLRALFLSSKLKSASRSSASSSMAKILRASSASSKRMKAVPRLTPFSSLQMLQDFTAP